MLDTLKAVFDRRSQREQLIDEPVDATTLLNAPPNHLDRRVIPTLAVKHYPSRHSKPSPRIVRLVTVCTEHRLRTNHPEVADTIDSYDWIPSADGPRSRTVWTDLYGMTALDWSTRAPLGGKKSWTYSGDLRFRMYPIDTTNLLLDCWFNYADTDRETIESVVKDVLSDHKRGASISRFSLLDEAVEIKQSFKQESKHH